jgi:ubiquinone/menaquinone biosynthesis C-methylase UbiE
VEVLSLTDSRHITKVKTGNDIETRIRLIHKLASKEDLSSSATLRIFKHNPKFFKKVLYRLEDSLKSKERMLDLGCGYGFTTKFLADCLSFREVFGIDMDDTRLGIAQERCSALKINLETDQLPFPDEFFDIAISFGVLEHLRYYDNCVKEAYRVLQPGGVFFVNFPNLGAWVNRLLLLLGYQPRDVEISESLAMGLPNAWPKTRRESYGHIHAPTLRAMSDLLRNYGFQIVATFGISCIEDPLSQTAETRLPVKVLLRVLDKIFSLKKELSLRLFIIANKGS